MSNKIEIKGMGKIKFEKLKDKNKNSKGIPIKNSKYLTTINYKQLYKLIDNNYIFSFFKSVYNASLYQILSKQ